MNKEFNSKLGAVVHKVVIGNSWKKSKTPPFGGAF
jgi:hypothetical protein